MGIHARNMDYGALFFNLLELLKEPQTTGIYNFINSLLL